MSHVSLSIGQMATLACVMEATAPKPGNVHRGADFEDVSFADFLTACVAWGPEMDVLADGGRVGRAVLRSVRTMIDTVGTNTHLGSLLLIAPLAAAGDDDSLREGVAQVLASLDEDDATDVYAAIREAKPGGLGASQRHDVAGPPPTCLLEAMRLAADRDSVAREYTTDFTYIFDVALPCLKQQLDAPWPLAAGIVRLHVYLMSQFPDSLIARKCGLDVTRQAQAMAARTLSAGRPGEPAYERALADLDFWLRGDGHRRNPGTTADLVSATLFAALRMRVLAPQYRMWSSSDDDRSA